MKIHLKCRAFCLSLNVLMMFIHPCPSGLSSLVLGQSCDTWGNLKIYGKINLYLSNTKHNKTTTVCTILEMYGMWGRNKHFQSKLQKEIVSLRAFYQFALPCVLLQIQIQIQNRFIVRCTKYTIQKHINIQGKTFWNSILRIWYTDMTYDRHWMWGKLLRFRKKILEIQWVTKGFTHAKPTLPWY